MLGIPSVLERLLPYVPIKRVQHIRHITETLDEASREVYENKKEAVQRGDDAVMRQLGKGKDIMSILVCFSFGAFAEVLLTQLFF
jgi:hypothetical protein